MQNTILSIILFFFLLVIYSCPGKESTSNLMDNNNELKRFNNRYGILKITFYEPKISPKPTTSKESHLTGKNNSQISPKLINSAIDDEPTVIVSPGKAVPTDPRSQPVTYVDGFQPPMTPNNCNCESIKVVKTKDNQYNTTYTYTDGTTITDTSTKEAIKILRTQASFADGSRVDVQLESDPNSPEDVRLQSYNTINPTDQGKIEVTDYRPIYDSRGEVTDNRFVTTTYANEQAYQNISPSSITIEEMGSTTVMQNFDGDRPQELHTIRVEPVPGNTTIDRRMIVTGYAQGGEGADPYVFQEAGKTIITLEHEGGKYLKKENFVPFDATKGEYDYTKIRPIGEPITLTSETYQREIQRFDLGTAGTDAVMAMEDQDDSDLANSQSCSTSNVYFLTRDIIMYKNPPKSRCSYVNHIKGTFENNSRSFWLIKNGGKIRTIKDIASIKISDDEIWEIRRIHVPKEMQIVSIPLVPLVGKVPISQQHNLLEALLDKMGFELTPTKYTISQKQCDFLQKNQLESHNICDLKYAYGRQASAEEYRFRAFFEKDPTTERDNVIKMLDEVELPAYVSPKVNPTVSPKVNPTVSPKVDPE